MNHQPYKLTKHPIGSVKEIWTVSWPLMFGFLATGIMLFIDRLLLGRYSLASMNAVSTASTALYAIIVLPQIIAAISEVFVGQYHGEDSPKLMGAPVWQMIWFSLLMTPLFIIFVYFGSDWLFKGVLNLPMVKEYYTTILSFGALFCLAPALMGFFIGQGKSFIVAVVCILANIINIVLDIILIFGMGKIPAMGIKGAAIATVVAEGIMVLCLFLCFVRKKNRIEKGVANSRFNLKLFCKCIKIGFPSSVGHVSEYFAYFLFFRLMNSQGAEFLTVIVLMHSLYLLIFFIMEGLSKGVAAISANLIGARKLRFIKKNILSSMKLHLIFAVILASIFVSFSPEVFKIFVSESEKGIFESVRFNSILFKSSIFLCCYFLLEGWAFILFGMLLGAADTKYLMIVGIITPWLIYFLPIYLAINYLDIDASGIWLIFCFYGACLLGILGARYLSGAWKNKRLSLEEDDSQKELLDV